LFSMHRPIYLPEPFTKKQNSITPESRVFLKAFE